MKTYVRIIENCKMGKAIFFDVDGTLLSHRTGDTPESTIEAIRLLKEKGCLIVMASGRHPSELKSLHIDGIEFDDYITTNGQIIMNHDWKLIADNPVPKDVLWLLADAFESKLLPLQFCTIDDLYMNYLDDYSKKILDSIHTPYHKTAPYCGEKIYQCVAYEVNEHREWLDAISEKFCVTSWHPDAVDIITKGGGKAWGIKAYLDAKGISREETIAFGDGENDLEMIRFAKIGVAMGNATRSLKENADFITTDIDDDGVYNAAIRLGMI